MYRARDPRIGREVAIKVLPASFSSDPDRLRRRSRQPPFGVPRVGVRGDPCRDRTPRCIGVCATRVNPTSGPQTHKAGSSPARLLLPRVAVMLLLEAPYSRFLPSLQKLIGLVDVYFGRHVHGIQSAPRFISTPELFQRLPELRPTV